MKFIAIAIVVSIPSLANANANLCGNVDNNGDANQVLQGASDMAEGQAHGPPQHIPGQLLVKFKSGASKSNRSEAMAAARGASIKKIHTAAMRKGGDKEGVTVMRTGLGVPEAVAAMIASGEVKYAEPNLFTLTRRRRMTPK
jgi:hypothetical protein